MYIIALVLYTYQASSNGLSVFGLFDALVIRGSFVISVVTLRSIISFPTEVFTTITLIVSVASSIASVPATIVISPLSPWGILVLV
jgi:hypothetical protein